MPAYHLTPAEADELMDSHRRAWGRVHSIEKKDKNIKETTFQAVEVSAMALGFGFVRGRWKGDMYGIPVDLAGGVVLHAAGLFGGPKYANHLHNLGDGALASFFTTLGAGLGASHKTTTTAGALPLLLPMGNPVPTKGPLSERELVSLIQSTVPRAQPPAGTT